MYATYRRCKVESTLLQQVCTWGSVVFALYAIWLSLWEWKHLKTEEINHDSLSFCRLEANKTTKQTPRCSSLNATGMCVEWDWLDVATTGSDCSEMFVATYVKEMVETGGPKLQRLGDEAKRSGWKKSKELDFYVAPPEIWDLILEHRVLTEDGVLEGQELSGFLPLVPRPYLPALEHVRNGVPLSRVDIPKRTKPQDNRLRVNLGDLLHTAGISSLDDKCSFSALYNLTGEQARLRQVGLELDVTFFYSNLWWNRLGYMPRYLPFLELFAAWVQTLRYFLPPHDVTFEVQVTASQPHEGVRFISQVNNDDAVIEPEVTSGRYRIKRRTHGIRIRFHQRGIVGKFSTSALVAYIVEFLVMMGMGWKIAEILVDLAPLGMQLMKPILGKGAKDRPDWYPYLESELERDLLYKKEKSKSRGMAASSEEEPHAKKS